MDGNAVDQDPGRFLHLTCLLRFLFFVTMDAMVRGEAKDNRERFEFTVAPYVAGGFLLTIRYSGDGTPNTTGAGVWPTVEKAKEIAEETAQKLLNGATVTWESEQK
jgi:hypothetical protein